MSGWIIVDGPPENLHSVRGCPKKIEKNVKRKHYFCKFGAPLSHLRLARRDFFLLRCSNFRSKTYHSVRGYPKKVEKTSSENTTFDNSEHPYRTCGSSVCVFFLFGSSPMSVFLWKTNDFLKILVQVFDFLLETNDFHRLSLKSWNFKWNTDDFLRLLCKSVIFHQHINGKAN